MAIPVFTTMNQFLLTRLSKPGMALVVLVTLFTSHVAGRQVDSEPWKVTGTTMGVVEYAVTAYCDSEQQAELTVAIDQELESVNQRMSTYIPESEVSRFNASSSTDWFSVSQETARVVQRALEISELSSGAFDITVQPLVQLWNFGSDKDPFSVPDTAAIQETLHRVGYQHLSVKMDPPSLRKSIPGLQIDLSSIAKGYAVDQVAGRLMQAGIDDFLVEVGGEIRASGEKPGNLAWRVGIEKPDANQRVTFQIVTLFHKALASSGDYRNFREVNGKRYSHTIDPVTGRPVEHGIAAASVIAADCMTADAVATAIMVLGKETGIQFAESIGVAALVMERKAGNQIVATRSSNFPLPGIKQRPTESEASVFRMIAIASLFFLVAVIAMAIGVIFGRERIKGSCGGIAALDNPDIAPECSLCSRAAECNDLKKEVRRRASDSQSE